MPPTLITLVRHAEGHHNVNEQYHLRDPYLTDLGTQQCLTLPSRFPPTPPISLLVTSPLKRTIQTTILGFPSPIACGVPVLALPELQETSDLPCDTGSDAGILAADPMLKTTSAGGKVNIDFSGLEEGWTSKMGKWASGVEALKERAVWVRRWLKGREEDHVVCVLHGGFLHYLTEDWTG
ncbi:phosphoglycerate mutase-like protein, partial [Wilcoxina mikolae CBS 423.85]